MSFFCFEWRSYEGNAATNLAVFVGTFFLLCLIHCVTTHFRSIHNLHCSCWRGALYRWSTRNWWLAWHFHCPQTCSTSWCFYRYVNFVWWEELCEYSAQFTANWERLACFFSFTSPLPVHFLKCVMSIVCCNITLLIHAFIASSCLLLVPCCCKNLKLVF